MPALILMYHDLAESTAGIPAEHRAYVLAPSVFQRQMRLAATSSLRNFTVAEWCAPREPSRGLVMTFDDGHTSNHDLALPRLLEHGLKATFFVTAGRIGTGDTMNWRQIRALHNAGMEIGSHTLTHRPPALLKDNEMRYELVESRRILEDGLGAGVTSISSPTGFFNVRMREIAREAGYRALCFGQAGLAPDGGDPFSLNRVAVKRKLGDRQFQRLLRFDPVTLGAMRSKQWMREQARRTLGVDSYLRLRRFLIRTGSLAR